MRFTQSVDLENLFKAGDANQDGVLTFNEFPIVPTKAAKIKVIKVFVMVGGLYICYLQVISYPHYSSCAVGKCVQANQAYE